MSTEAREDAREYSTHTARYTRAPGLQMTLRSPLFKLVALTLLAMQGWIGVGRGQVFCVPLAGCEPAEVTCGECDSCSCCGETHGHDHPAAIAPVTHDPCGCCLHLPTPDPDQLPQARSEISDGARDAVAMLPAAAIDLSSILLGDRAAGLVSATWHPPPDHAMLAQVRGLKCTRLNI